MTKEEAHDALDRAVQDYAAVVMDESDGVGMAKWVLSAHVDILSTNSSGYVQAVSDSLAIHEQMGLLNYSQIQVDASMRQYVDDDED